MAEAVVGVLIVKLGAALAKEAAIYGASLLSKEASALKGLFGEIRKAERELESMKAYLRESEKCKDTDETTGIFIKNIREISFQMEDVIDEFMYKLEDDKHGGFAAKIKKRIKHLKVWHRLAQKLCDINAELKEAAKRRARYVIPGMHGHAGSSDHHARSSNQNLCFAREDDVVGIEHNATKLKHWILGDLEEQNYKIATVWGMGVGKTTLVDHVYKIVKLDFDAAAWVTVSRSYQIEDLLKRIAREFGILIDVTNMEIRSSVEIIRKYLEGKKYILVLDDVWEKDVWINNIMEVFPSNCTSRVVLTSRNFQVASLATCNCTIKLEPLEREHSWKLFCKTAFRNSDDKRCPSELHDLAVKFLEKCEGLPITIACIGRLLSFKQPTYSEWDSVYKELELQSTNNVIPGVDIILKVSLEDLPHELKNCFLHCAIFPEDYILKRKRLIRHWITGGFIKKDGKNTFEEVADGCLNELVNRSLLQVVKKNEFGRVKHCRMHDIIHNLVLNKAKEECFGKIYKGPETFSVDSTRRLSIQSASIETLHESCANPNRNGQSRTTHLRAIHAFTSYVDIELLRPVIASSHLLSTMDLEGCQIKRLPNEVFNLFNLRFLGLRYTGIEILPEAVGRLQNLEVLDALFTPVSSFPKDVGKLNRLWVLCASKIHKGPNLVWHGGIKVPRTITNLTGLHNLQTIEASLETLSDVAALTKLRALSVCNVKKEHASNLCKAIKNMEHLVNLTIATSDNENQVLPLETLDLPGTISRLVLQGCLEKERMPRIISSWLQLKSLTKLSLISSKLDEVSFSSLMELRGLCYLELVQAYDGKKLHFSESSFPRLKRLGIFSVTQLNQVQIEEGALETLEELRFNNCPKLECIPQGIEYLAALEELYLENIADELVEKFIKHEGGMVNEFKEELAKMSHIKFIFVMSTEKKYRKRIVPSKVEELAG